MESFFLYIVKELGKQIGPVGGLLLALVLFLFFYERKSREALADKLFDLALKQTTAMTEFTATFDALDRELDHGFHHMDEHFTTTDRSHERVNEQLADIQRTLDRMQQNKEW